MSEIPAPFRITTMWCTECDSEIFEDEPSVRVELHPDWRHSWEKAELTLSPEQLKLVNAWRSQPYSEQSVEPLHRRCADKLIARLLDSGAMKKYRAKR